MKGVICVLNFRGFEVSGEFDTSCAHARCNELTHAILQRVPFHHHDRVKMAYMELLANALQASERYGGQTIGIAWELSDGLLTLRLTNEGVEFTPVARDFLMPDPMAEHGRGIPLAIRLTDGLHYHHDSGNTVVTAYWELDQPFYSWKEAA